jgi:hypothetical protein
MKPRKIDLNRWVRVNSIEDTDGYQCMIIVPQRLIDGTQPPDLFFRKGEPSVPKIEDINSSVWYKDCQISNNGSNIDYNKRVDWWFESAENDEEYKEIINNTFNVKDEHNPAYGFNVRNSWEKAKGWLKRIPLQSARKTYLHKFIWNWLTGDINKYMRKQERGY